MFKIFNYFGEIWQSSTILNKLLFILYILIIYRLLVFLPVPFIDIHELMNTLENNSASGSGETGGLEFFAMLMGGSLEQFSIIAVGLIPFINASIIMQLLTAVLPKLEELKEQGDVGTMKIQQYTRYLTLPLAFVQSYGMVFLMNSVLGGTVIDTSFLNITLAAFTMTVATMFLIWLGELITEKGLANGISLLIFSSIVSGISSQVYSHSSGGFNIMSIIFTLLVVLILIVLAVFLIKTKKEIPIVYSRQGQVQDTATLPIPLNPVGMVPIIFAIAFITFPYLLSQIVLRYSTNSEIVNNIANWITNNLSIYSEQPSVIAILVYFLLIVLFTFFYTIIIFNPERISDNIQKRGGFIPGIRPGEETSKYINSTLYHLCLWGGVGLGIIGIYSYIIYYIPFIEQGSIPVVVQGAGIIIIVGVVQDIINKLNAQLSMEKYDKI
ncbi:preprotein translocase subunit SecY [Candidatus Vampirococcus lugosii]|uniref:Protein translocase subunit SecY n=1 Tax=Candidatus Vampirococcus lugosii TaxID=2789015 RepID=A0ABS5QKZ0_9BACT|nr:preprotein translocase subunit SecY [Candidatus Vampirococcus lugosii]MBS8121885.1 preprotein translocase subunit SecY [Candidatus Vampirococcus lugosii]